MQRGAQEYRHQPQEDDEDVEFDENVLKRAESFDHSMKLPVKSHLGKLEETCQELLKDLQNSRKEIQTLRSDLVALEHFNKEASNEITKYVMEEMLRVEKEFKRLLNVDAAENTFLKQQVNQLNQDKVKLQQNALILETRVHEGETEVGFKNVYD
eukprot:TRINITY_DN7765_c0_g1_i1.p1 TRINITY_DN7765_c0_g1~~TRINITY_DN7765_c0_g1_i1.p1  ORF type:complete len:155 (+),score=38.11 TRINITY_DN7765_c0_g1_i1:134-598(+)